MKARIMTSSRIQMSKYNGGGVKSSSYMVVDADTSSIVKNKIRSMEAAQKWAAKNGYEIIK